MLIRNVKSKFDLDNARKIQQEMLNLQIENEKILEERVANYQNPNKAPPVPPQYKTSSEIQKDIFTLEREAMTNLTNLGISSSDALTVTTSLKNRKDGVANLLKLNKNFPYIKKDIGERFQPKLLDPSVILTYLDEVFYNIDETLGLYPKTYGGQYATAMDVTGQLPTPRMIKELKYLVTDSAEIIDYANVSKFKSERNNREFELLINRLDFLINNLPSDDALIRIEALSTLERNKFNKIQDKLIRINRIPTAEFIASVSNELELALNKQIRANNNNSINSSSELASGSAISGDEIRINPDRIIEIVGKIKNVLGAIDKTSEDALIAFNNRLLEIEKTFRSEFSLGEKSSGLTRAEARESEREMVEAELKEKADYIKHKINHIGPEDGKKRMQLKFDFKNEEPTIIDDGDEYKVFENFAPLNQARYDKQVVVLGNENGVYEYRVLDGIEYSKIKDKLDKFLLIGSLRQPTKVIQRETGQTRTVVVSKAQKGKKKVTIEEPIMEDVIVPDYEVDPEVKYEQRFDRRGVIRYLKKNELPDLLSKIETDPNYNPKINIKDRLIPEQGFGVSSKKSAFKSTRIKIGKGLEVEEQPRFKTFGKYIIHMPHLVNDNVLNVKFPSGGAIPSIKPVQINNNFKEFINDLLETGKFDERHYNSLSKGERDHFMKIAKGANLIGKLGVKQPKEDEENEKKDVDRFELLKGEYDAGNNNDKMIKELRALVIKFIHSGKINKKQGMEFLMELSLV